jgi:hypothetical protein
MGPIAESFGGYDFSAFARDYRALFSELPSETAQASEREPGAKASLGWLVCAATFHAQAERNNAALSRSATSGRSSAV